MAASRRIILTTFGSFGDLHPYISLALELQSRGHHAIIATSEIYREKIESLKIGFHPMRPNLPAPEESGDIIAEVMDARNGTAYLFNQMLMPALRDTYTDLREALRGADLLISHPLIFAAPILAQQTGIKWISTVLSPISIWSVYDPPAPPLAPFLHRLRHLGPGANRALLRLVKRVAASWVEPVQQLREELGLARGPHPLFEGQHAPELALALFSPELAPPQPDWPTQLRATGFCFYDRKDDVIGIPAKLMQFLMGGPAPIIFTLGSAAVFDAGDFYQQSIGAAQALDRRALLLIGDDRNLPADLPEGIAVADYAPYSNVFPYACAIVHQGGIGTTGQSLRAGKPMLVVPYSHDQPDNAARVERLGIGRTIRRAKYNAARATSALASLLNDPQSVGKAAQIGQNVQAENGARAACDAIEEYVQKP